MKKENLIIILAASFLLANFLNPLFLILGFIFPKSTIFSGIVNSSLIPRRGLGAHGERRCPWNSVLESPVGEQQLACLSYLSRDRRVRLPAYSLEFTNL